MGVASIDATLFSKERGKGMAEILAPAGSKEALIAAVRSGADAVYLGLRDLSARKNAENFSPEELISACRYCRERGVRVYLAVNTLIKDNEFGIARKVAEAAAKAGVDALIVADLGLIRYFSKTVPSIPIHASTQCTVLSEEAAKFLEGLGVKRIVLGRELSKEEIIKIRKAVKCELEVFVHGALCMSVSGQCLFSSYLGGRSGNRGLCAAPCRLPFKSDISGNSYALSLKDNSLYDKIGELSEIGIESYKIEGRMKRPEYVSAAVKSLRDAIDKGNYDKELLENVFSRDGFTSSYFDGNLKSGLFGIREDGSGISEAEAFPRIHEFYKAERARIPIRAAVEFTEKGFKLTFSDGEREVSRFSDLVSPAKTRAVDKEIIEEKLSRLGSTPFYLEKADISLSDGLYISLSEINRLKGEAAEELLRLRGEFSPIEIYDYEFSAAPNYKGSPNRRYAYLKNTEQAEEFDKIFTDISKIYLFPPEKTVIAMPRYFSPEKGIILREKLKEAYSKGYRYASADNLNALGLLLEFDFNIIGTAGLNVLNSESIRLLEEAGIKELILSTENSFAGIRSMKSNIPLGIVLYQYTPLMLLRACPIRGARDCGSCRYRGGVLRDRKGIEFKIRCSEEYSELLNSRPLCTNGKEDKIFGAEIGYYDLSEKKPLEEYTLGLYENKLI